MADKLFDLANVRVVAFEKAHLLQRVRWHSTHCPRTLLLYGLLRERFYSRLLVEEAARLLQALGVELRILSPRDLSLPDLMPADHPRVQEVRSLSLWSGGHVWCSPERHRAIAGTTKAQIDRLP